MTYSQNLLTGFKARNGGISDYKVAQIVGCTRQNISLIKKGTTGFSPEVVIKLAKEIGEDPKEALLKRLIESAESDEMRQILEEIKNKIEH